MNIKRYKAADMRSAFKQIRAEHGAEVVILSSRRIRDGVEVVVALDAGGARESLPTPAAASGQAPQAEVMNVKITSSGAPEAVRPVITPTVPPAATAGLDGEIRALRRLLESQLAALAWNDLSRRSPAVAEVMRELTEMGFARDIVSQVLAEPAEPQALGHLRETTLGALSARLPTLEDRWIEQGGRVVFVGPAGSGKSTALASVAARWVMRNGAHSAALVSAVESRFGVRDSLQRTGRLVGLPVFVADQWQEIPALLKHLADRRLVLIDTPSVGFRQAEFAEHLLGLSSCGSGAEFALALSAASQAGAVREAVQRFQPLGGLSAVITHLDECSSLGGLLSVLIEHQIPAAYTQSGPRLMDDLRPARADRLIETAAQLSRAHGATADEELLSQRMEQAYAS